MKKEIHVKKMHGMAWNDMEIQGMTCNGNTWYVKAWKGKS
jgi:hypothetical protein